jgi:hypothetical protein
LVAVNSPSSLSLLPLLLVPSEVEGLREGEGNKAARYIKQRATALAEEPLPENLSPKTATEPPANLWQLKDLADLGRFNFAYEAGLKHPKAIFGSSGFLLALGALSFSYLLGEIISVSLAHTQEMHFIAAALQQKAPPFKESLDAIQHLEYGRYGRHFLTLGSGSFFLAAFTLLANVIRTRIAVPPFVKSIKSHYQKNGVPDFAFHINQAAAKELKTMTSSTVSGKTPPLKIKEEDDAAVFGMFCGAMETLRDASFARIGLIGLVLFGGFASCYFMIEDLVSTLRSSKMMWWACGEIALSWTLFTVSFSMSLSSLKKANNRLRDFSNAMVRRYRSGIPAIFKETLPTAAQRLQTLIDRSL